MVRLGLQLTLRSGREALARALLTAVAVAIGVTILLSVLAGYHAFEATSGRPCWECTVAAGGQPPKTRSELWNFSENIYQGHFVEVLDVAALGPGAPVPPGITHLPRAGQFYASPALAQLLRTVPRRQLGARFPGTLSGTVGYQALSGPTELVAVVGYAPAELGRLPGTVTVDRVATYPDNQGTTGIYRTLFWIGAVVVLFPLLVLVNTATRLAAARREERFAAMRLVGATPRQVNTLAAVEAAVSALLGALLGAALFQALRPGLADLSFSGARFFERYVTPTVPGYLALVAGVPVLAVVASLWSLRRVRISPLGVSRRVTPPPPGLWRLLPVVVGVPLFVLPFTLGSKALDQGSSTDLWLVVLGTLLIMVGLVASGPWLTLQSARVLSRAARGPSSLLAARRLADSPKAAFRTVSGLVLAVFVASLVACIVPAFKFAQTNLGGEASALTGVLRVPEGVPPATAGHLMAQLKLYPGTTVLPLYANPLYAVNQAPPPRPPGGRPLSRSAAAGAVARLRAVALHRGHAAPGSHYDAIVGCAGLRAMPALGRCAPGVTAVYAETGDTLFTDNPLYVNLPIVKADSPVAHLATGGLALEALLVKAPTPAVLEEVRTTLTLFSRTSGTGHPAHDGSSLSAWQMGDLEAETFGEVAGVRNNDMTNAEDVVLALVGLTLFGAACSLAVTVAGGIVERRRPFTLLRLSGAPFKALSKVVVLESVLPLFSAAVVAAVTGIGVAVPLVKALPKLQHAHRLAFPGPAYYAALGTGLVVALAVVSTALPLLARTTHPGSARFE